MVQQDLWSLLDESYYMICIFDEDKTVLKKNKKFEYYFKDVCNYSDFQDNIIMNEKFENCERIYVKSNQYNEVVKFEICNNGNNSLIIGVQLSHDKIMNMLKQVEYNPKNDENDLIKYVDFNKNRSYCTFILDKQWIVKHYSHNVLADLNISNPYLKSISDVFGQEFLDKIIEKSDYLDIFNDLFVEYKDKLAVISKSEYGYIVINLYPYSNDGCHKIEEVNSLKLKIDELENELKRRKQLIEFQKNMIRELSNKSNDYI